jgi:predicted dehydrogenase
MTPIAPERPRVAVVGTGSIGRRHLEVLLQLGCGSLVAVSEQRRLDRLEIAGTPISVSDRLDDVIDDIDAVVVASTTSLHLGHLRSAIEAGRHVLVEKPVATQSDGLDALVDDARSRGLVAAAGHQFRYEPGLVTIRDMVHRGALGVLLAVEAHQGEHLADYHPDEDYRVGYAARRDLGGGVLRTQIHHIDVLEWIFGPLERVYACGGHVTDLEVDVEDSASYLFRSAGGTPVYGHVDYRQRPRIVTLRVIGTDGILHWDHYGARLTHTPSGADAITTTWPYDRQAMFVRQMADFLDAIVSGAPLRATLQEGVRAVRLVEAIERSYSTDRSVAIASRSDSRSDG